MKVIIAICLFTIIQSTAFAAINCTVNKLGTDKSVVLEEENTDYQIEDYTFMVARVLNVNGSGYTSFHYDISNFNNVGISATSPIPTPNDPLQVEFNNPSEGLTLTLVCK